MKNTIRFVLTAFAALFLASCAGTYSTPLGDVHVNDGPIGYGNPPPQRYAGDGHDGPPGGRQSRPWGQEIASKQRWLTQEDNGTFLRIQAAASPQLTLQVRDEAGNWARQLYNTHGVWPSFSEMETKVTKTFAAHNHPLIASQAKGPGVFIITKYEQDQVVKHEKVKDGSPVMSKRDIMQDDVPPSVLERSRKGKPDSNPVETRPNGDRLYLGESIQPNT